MILSPKHNFLLIKNYKVGGTSLEVELSQIIDDEDAIITKIQPNNPEHIAKNFVGYYNHMSYREVANKLGFDYVNTLESAVFVRNPFDVVLSHFYMAANWSKIDNINSDIVDKYFNDKLMLEKMSGIRSRGIYTIDNIIGVNNVFKYEDGIDQFNALLSRVGISPVAWRYTEKQYKPKEIKPLSIFKEKHLDIIRNDWAWEFETFDYSTDPTV